MQARIARTVQVAVTHALASAIAGAAASVGQSVAGDVADISNRVKTAEAHINEVTVRNDHLDARASSRPWESQLRVGVTSSRGSCQRSTSSARNLSGARQSSAARAC